ncbi:hypothetical protein RF679_01425 [Undibacterium cyanobacteriorum]|uniref:Membrane protein 6-pyruvoyl-tetrahydropterin synthase-related domain-containing protein n=1 Tax=Undibacterium cyanobacteriorum TaxID=3073561 RepID=A0ABY9RIG0_9BURK|nr:hypothetical protein [Undibacterium sp. 20NA77.5]WMW80957.1 hypothetical protein RF679_01425 [Undibacterium sp. 20NA77.5]
MNNAVFFQTVPTRHSTLLCWLYFLVLLGAYAFVYLAFMPGQNGAMGHDYSYMFPAWFDGLIWFREHGLEIPWFSPSFCAGAPFFADPQSTYYSLPQFLVFIMSPLDAAVTTLLLMASALFWGTYLLMRYCFETHRNTALLVAGLLMLNGFLPHRIIVGHITFHGFALIPWVALLLLLPLRSRWRGAVCAIGAGFILAYWVHSGLGSLVLACSLTVAIICILAMLRKFSLYQRCDVVILLQRSVLAMFFGGALAASKLVSGFAFLGQFPRTFYSLPGVGGFGEEIMVMFGALFLPSQQAYQLGMPHMRNLQWDLAPHEWAYNFPTVLSLFLVFGGAYVALQNKDALRLALKGNTVRILVVLMLLLSSIPFLLNYWSPAWNEFLKKIPIVNSLSSSIRWVLVWIPLLAILMGLIHEHFQNKPRGALITLVLSAIAVWQMVDEPREYYAAQGYSMVPLMIADQHLKSGSLRPEIQSLGLEANLRYGEANIPLRVNDTVIAGVSQIACYSAIFGYRLEKFSAQGLSIGPVLAKSGNGLNLKNPACYVFPDENQCAPGDQFRVDQLEQAQKFVRYQTFDFAMPPKQRYANLLSLSALYLGLATLLIFLGSLIFKRKRYAE